VKGPQFAAIVLAGGLSSRMKQFKPLLPLGGATIIEHVIATFKHAGADVFLVTGHRQEEIKSVIKTPGITIIYNPDYEKGMFSSIQAGIRHLPPGYQGFLMLPVDIPMVKTGTIKLIMQAGVNHPENIIYPVYDGKRGHPPLIPASLMPEILDWNKEGGLKSFLLTREKSALDIPVTDSSILFDIDTPEDYENLLKRYRRY